MRAEVQMTETPLFAYTLRLADNALILGHRERFTKRDRSNSVTIHRSEKFCIARQVSVLTLGLDEVV